MTGSPSVIIGDFDFIRSVSLPEKTNPPLIVDPDAVLSGPILFRSVQKELPSEVRWQPPSRYLFRSSCGVACSYKREPKIQ